MEKKQNKWITSLPSWLAKSDDSIRTKDGLAVNIFELKYQEDVAILSDWAFHFRNHYCLDEHIDILRNGTGLSRKEYLVNLKFPDVSMAPGPSIRAGDFGEILIADYLEYILGYWVPRTRYGDKDIRNESSKGSDTIGFLFEDDNSESPKDQLIIFESKAKFSGNDPSDSLQLAVNDSAKDLIRKAESLNALKQRFLIQKEFSNVNKIARFQNEIDNPYVLLFGAVSHVDINTFDILKISETDCSTHPHRKILNLIVIKGNEMMKLVHSLYERAADEA